MSFLPHLRHDLPHGTGDFARLNDFAAFHAREEFGFVFFWKMRTIDHLRIYE